MTAGELIRELQLHDPETPVVLYSDGQSGGFIASKIEALTDVCTENDTLSGLVLPNAIVISWE